MNSVYFRTQFLTSAHKLSQLPPDTGVEIAFAGRSNSGKSSAINTITQTRNLARSSKTPGRTQLLNYFEVLEQRYIVDLPGYGYAKVPQQSRQHWSKTLGAYIQARSALQCVVIVMDARRPLTGNDWQMIDWCLGAGVNLHCLLTKADKLNRSNAAKALLETQAALEKAGVEATLQLFSSLKKQGIDDAHELLDMWLFNSPRAQQLDM
ncbi:MAG TPA: YihA family ribosome biogenesis GTP-binding protein [Gammaproteobacteria bacterium]|nr:YihA family ribosome biogenesis GTP-binding protein [Gammaproteobacteria bacterium]